MIYGLTENTQRGHIVRATLEAVCFQVRDILGAMTKDCNFHLVQLQVDGGMTANKLLLQLQADLVGLEVICPKMAESTALVINELSQLFLNVLKISLKILTIIGCSDSGWKSCEQMGYNEKIIHRSNNC